LQFVVATDISAEFVVIPPGHFLMGSNNALYSEAPVHSVCFQSSFLLGRYPVTQAQWQAVMGFNPSSFGNHPDQPVENVSWDEATEFCRRLGAQSRRRVRLPSEAEWEYACRAGTTNEFFLGPWGPFVDDSEIPWAVRDALLDYAWFDLNSGGRSQPVGLKRPNPWEIHDMIGNVWEWCADVWHGDYVGAPSDGGPWLERDGQQPRRCLRGGAWDMSAFRCRATYRSHDHKTLATNRFGFRMAMDAE
jgi:formylglycine-generating enzyme required for sulfatase activity